MKDADLLELPSQSIFTKAQIDEFERVHRGGKWQELEADRARYFYPDEIVIRDPRLA